MKPCKGCRHLLHVDNHIQVMCTHPKVVSPKTNWFTGETEQIPQMLDFARAKSGACGEDAKLFELDKYHQLSI